MSVVSKFGIREFWCSVLLGSVTCVLSAVYDGVDGVIQFIKAISPTLPVMLWFVALWLAPSIAGWLIFSRHVDVSLTNPSGITRAKEILNEVSLSIHGLYRTAAGAALVVFLPILIIEPTALNLGRASTVLLFSAGSLFICCLFSDLRRPRG